jgi:Zn-dependent peptidase ImmA (M78 family)
MRWSDAHRIAMISAADLQEELGLNTYERIDVFDALATVGLKLIFRKLDGCAALYLPASPLGGRAGVILHVGHPLALQRYSAGHELGHHMLGHGVQADRSTEPRRDRGEPSDEEKLAEAFAAWFLMPPDVVEQTLRRLGLRMPHHPRDAYALGLRLGTSYRATCVHLANLKLASAATAKSWSELELKSIKQELSDEPPLGGWRADIWLLTEGDLERTLVARCGDRLLLDMPDLHVESMPSGLSTTTVPSTDLLSSPRLALDVSPDMDAGPATLVLAGDERRAVLTLTIERPRQGLYVPPREVRV